MSAEDAGEVFMVRLLAETTTALLCEFSEGAGPEDLWVPKSVIVEEDSEILDVGEQGYLAVQRWWAQKYDLA